MTKLQKLLFLLLVGLQKQLHSQQTSHCMAETEMRVAIFLAGLPGAMAKETARVCLGRNLKISNLGIFGKDQPRVLDDIPELGSVKLLPSKSEETKKELKTEISSLKEQGFTPIAIDFTHPEAVHGNAELYNSLGLPFVMGTTGADFDVIVQSTLEAKNYAVIAPNMCKQIVAFQAMFEFMEKNFPNSFFGYDLQVTESHQKSKKDTSGTAKAVVKSLEALTGNAENDEKIIKKMRTDEDSERFGVPKEYLGGHAYHTYSLQSSDRSVTFEFKHNVNGRATYAEGAVDAALFLARHLKPKAGKVYNMIDVLKSGNMI